MNATRLLRALSLAGAALAGLAAMADAGEPRASERQTQDKEVQMGQAVFNELKAKGEIIESSPLYDELLPVVEPILRAAQTRYNHPFKVYLVHEPQPVDALEQHFRSSPSVFQRFSPDPASATPFVVARKAPEVFLR